MEIQGNIVDIENRRVYPGTVVIRGKKITSIIERTPLNPFDLTKNKSLPFILPGFIDSHIHLEMTNLMPSEYARAALSQGIVACLADCHDLANVAGREGILELIKNSKKIPFNFYFSAPSTLVKDLYTYEDIQKLLEMEEVTHLGEIQNYPDVILHEKYIEELLKLAKNAGKPVDGCSPGVSGENLEEYVKSGISTDHQCISQENVLEKIKKGMKVALACSNLDLIRSCAALFFENASFMMFCGQSMYAPTVSSSYINCAVSNAVKEGGDLFGVLEAACLTPVRHYKLNCGTLHSGDDADFILCESLEKFNVIATFIKGDCVYMRPQRKTQKDEYSFRVKNFASIKPKIIYDFVSKHVSEKDLEVSSQNKNSKSSAWELHPSINTINICDGEMTTVRTVMYLEEKDGKFESDIEKDCIKLVLYDRMGKNLKPALAFVHGFGIKKGAAAMSISHDSHNIIAVGVDDKDIALAINRVIDMRGGIALSVDCKIKAELPFSIAGLMADLYLTEINRKYYLLKKCFTGEMGCNLTYPVYTLSYLASTQIPSLKLSLNGLVNVVEQEEIPLVQ